MAGPISLLQRKGKDARVRALVEANTIVQHLRDTADLGIHFRPIPIERVRVCVFADASLNTVSGCKSQGATMLCLVDQMSSRGKDLRTWFCGEVAPSTVCVQEALQLRQMRWQPRAIRQTGLSKPFAK